MMTTYTAFNRNSGTVYGSGLDVTDAADIILTHDGHEFEIRPASDGLGFDLFVSRGSRNSFAGVSGFVPAFGRHRKPINAATPDREQAWREIATQVVAAGWDSVPVEAMIDAAFAEMMAEIE